MKNLLLLMLIVTFSPVYSADKVDPLKIMREVYQREDAKTLIQDMKMTSVDKFGNKRVKKMKVYSKYYGKDKRQIMFFTSPSSVRNTAFLTYDYNDESVKEDSQWIFLPKLKRIKHIASSSKSSSFMGSDFSYFDLTKPNLENYVYKYLGEEEVNGTLAWKIESIPKTSEIVQKFGYTRTINTIAQDSYMIIKSIGFMKNGKTKYMNILNTHKNKNIWIVDDMEMTTKRGEIFLHKTTMKLRNIRLNPNIKDKIFTIRRLDKGV
ncbi:MAG: outer membrane lipoprotein-sorting protein [Gammaproteobacteria bacterium]|nr:outer membrane lipoprotein-sorting protein [Gammaproteobacteria bacterium]